MGSVGSPLADYILAYKMFTVAPVPRPPSISSDDSAAVVAIDVSAAIAPVMAIFDAEYNTVLQPLNGLIPQAGDDRRHLFVLYRVTNDIG